MTDICNASDATAAWLNELAKVCENFPRVLKVLQHVPKYERVKALG
jgi:hypothetical protein